MGFGRQRELLGLDIGSSLTKVVFLNRSGGHVLLKQVALAATPARALSDGELTNAPTIAHHLRSLWSDYGIRVRRVAVAAGGEKVYSQLEFVSEDVNDDLQGFVETKAHETAPYPPESSTVDYQEFDQVFGTSSRAVLWVSCASEQVEWLREAVTLAGKTPAVVDVVACALANAFAYSYQPEASQAVILLHVGVRHVTVALVRGSVLLYARDAVTAMDWTAGGGLDSLSERVIGELDRHWDALRERAQPVGLQHVFLSGGASRAPELAEAVRQRTGLRVETMDPFRRISYSASSEEGRIAQEHGPTLAVAVGLALRSFEDL